MHRSFAVLAGLSLPLAALAQAPTPTIRTSGQIVIVDVSVADAHGNAVHNLKQSDFTVLENGAQQAINHFEEHAAATAGELAKAPAMPPLPPNVYTNFTVTPEDSPLNILLIDYLNTPVENQAHAREQLVSFVRSMKPGTRLAIFGLNSRLVLLQGFTSNPQTLLSVLSSKKGNPQTSPLIGDPLGTETLSDLTSSVASALGNDPGVVQVMENMQQVEAMQSSQLQSQRALYTLDAMNLLARYLAGMPGRKNLIWFSGSFPISILPDTNLKDTYQAFSVVNSSADQFRQTVDLLSRSQVAVYPVDSRGLFAQTMMTSAISGQRSSRSPDARNSDLDTFTTQTFDEHATMRQMAEATGGHAFVDTNSLGETVGRAIDSGSNYYTLVYSPTDKKWDGSYRKIAIHLASGNYTLAYRKGYYADAADPGLKSKPHTTEFAVVDTAKPTTVLPPRLDAMRAAMQRGAPDPTQIIFKAMLVASPTLTDKLADGNTAAPRSKPPYRIVTVAYAVNPGDVTMPQRPDGTRQVALEFVIFVYDRDGQLVTQQSNPVNVFAKPEAIKEFATEGIRYQQQIAVPTKGEYFLRVGVRDMIGDKVGAIEVPAAGIKVTP